MWLCLTCACNFFTVTQPVSLLAQWFLPYVLFITSPILLLLMACAQHKVFLTPVYNLIFTTHPPCKSGLFCQHVQASNVCLSCYSLLLLHLVPDYKSLWIVTALVLVLLYSVGASMLCFYLCTILTTLFQSRLTPQWFTMSVAVVLLVVSVLDVLYYHTMLYFSFITISWIFVCYIKHHWYILNYRSWYIIATTLCVNSLQLLVLLTTFWINLCK